MLYVVLFFLVIVLGVIATAATKSDARKKMSSHLAGLSNFSPTQHVIGEDTQNGFAFDETSKKICLLVKKTVKKKDVISTRVLDYRDLLSVELVEDGDIVTKTSRSSQLGGALLGGIVFGPLGAVVGGLSGKKKSETKAKRLDLRITVKDTSEPLHEVNFLNIEVEKSSALYDAAYKKATHWCALIKTLIEQAGADNERQAGIAGELRELAKLRNEGLLTETEFISQKAKLLKV